MRIITTTAAGLILGGLFSVQASANGGLLAGMHQPLTQTPITKTQFKIPFGMSAKKVRRILSRDGYSEIVITYIGLVDAKADVCRNGVRYRVKVRVNGSYEYRNKIGECRKAIQAADVRELIRKEGFRRIDIQDDGKIPYIASACRQGDRYNIEVSEFGDVKVGKRTGRCIRERNVLTPKELRTALRKNGYDRIKFTERTPRRFVVEACRDTTRERLEINRRGRIRDKQRIGRCPSAIRSRDLASIMRRDGFNRVDVVRDKPPYRVEACRNNIRIRVSLSSWGERLSERRIGECRPPATVASLTEDLRNNVRQFKAINVRIGRRYPFIANVCDNGQRRELYFSKYGKFEGNKDVGRCVSPRMSVVLDKLRDRGFRNAEVFVEACRRSGRRVRVKFDEYGNELSRERIGRCR